MKLLKSGLSAKQTLERLIADDPGRATRQVGIVDAKGNIANYTGDECNEWAGAVSGKHYTAQGNILAGEAVVKAMGKAFEETEGELAGKLMAALFAGQEKGGDTRGQQSAALLIVQNRAVTAVSTTGILICVWMMPSNRLKNFSGYWRFTNNWCHGKCYRC